MKHRERRLSVVLVLGLAALTARSAGAQPVTGNRPERPNRALFGGGVGSTDHLLTLSADLGGGLNDATFRAVEGAEQVERQSSSVNAAAGLEYGLTTRRVQFGLGARGSARHQPADYEGLVSSYQSSATTRYDITTRTAVTGTASLAYQPLTVVSLFPDMFGPGAPAIPTDYEAGTISENYVSQAGGLTLSQSLSRRTQVSGGYTYRRSGRSGDVPSQAYQGMRAGLSHELAQGLSARVGYGRGFGDYRRPGDTDRRVVNHTIDAGIDFARALSFSRATTFSFSTGSTIVSDSGVTRADLVGSATLAHELGRSWLTALSYSRQAGFVDVVAEPTFSDSVSARLSGLVARRLGVHAGVGGAWGTIGLSGVTNDYNAFHATAGLTTALTRMMAIEFGYIYYRYRFDSSAHLPTTIGRGVDRQSVQVSLALWAPLFHRARSTNAAR